MLRKARKDARCRLRELCQLIKTRRSPGFRLRAVYLPCKDKEKWKIQAVNGLPAPESKEMRGVQAEGGLPAPKSKERCKVQAEIGLPAQKSKEKPWVQAEGTLCCRTEQCPADSEPYLPLIPPRGFPCS